MKKLQIPNLKTCGSGKVRHYERETAEEEMARLQQRDKYKRHPVIMPLNVYLCRCGAYHVGRVIF